MMDDLAVKGVVVRLLPGMLLDMQDLKIISLPLPTIVRVGTAW